jgi:TrmH family RNA methyltransferase
MLSRELLGNVILVLVRARNPNNIGAVARAMHDFGCSRLRVVNEFAVPFEAARSAVDASTVLASAQSYTTVAEAVRDCTLVLGTTAVGDRAVRHRLVSMAEAAPIIRQELGRSARPQVALLFGSEKTGLSNEELSFCQILATIPMFAHEDARHPSMNLGQAVAVCLYELVRNGADTVAGSELLAGPEQAFEMPPGAELERVAALLGQVLEVTGYTRRHPAHTSHADLRRLVRKMGLDHRLAQVWMGILRQVLWKVAGQQEIADRE